MSEFKLTPSQQAAVDTRGRPILVSAAAGSGKTRVLTERLIARVMEGEDITRFLVITFTRAAAAELRARILTELNALSAENPGDRRLRRQSALLYRAQIGTIDSFCTVIVRENAHLLGISPAFSVLDEERSAELLARSLEEVMERAYGKIEDDPGLIALVDSVGAGRDDARLGELVRSLFLQMQSRAFPEKWASGVLELLDAESVTDVAGTPWGAYLLADAAAEASYRAQELEKALEIMSQPGNEPLYKCYAAPFSELALLFRDTVRMAGESWDKTRLCLVRDVPKLGSVRGFRDEELKNRVKQPWDDGKEALKKLKSDLAGSGESLLRGLRASKPALAALMGLVSALEEEYSGRKRRADACDFSDVEHFCVKLLCGSDGEPTEIARALSGRYAEVMVDEYQDVNAVQELIFRRVSGEGQRLFMVGDVKQSIYRFRLAEPSIFNAKYEAFSDAEKASRILLRENFRSRGCVLDACNAVFERIMSKALGEIEYDENTRLVQGAEYPAEGEILPELCILDAGDGGADEEEEPTPDKAMAEARYVAKRIRAMVDGGELISDGRGGTRPVAWRDIAILMRTPNTSGAPYRRALAELDIPLNCQQSGSFFSQPEVSFAVSMLAVADNPRQDVPLIAAMRGLPFSFTPDELAAVRKEDGGAYWDALCRRAQGDEKCARFVGLVRELRDISREEPPESVLRCLYDRTGLVTVCAVLPDGHRRGNNLMELYEYARKFTEGGNSGLFCFVNWLRELERRGIAPSVGTETDAVRLLSIHKSKGLEFPVVFLADNGHGWNRSATGQVLCHTELGIGMRMTDTERGIEWPTLPWRAIRKKIQAEELSEQERVLYVAMTRARERLIMTCTVKKAEETLQKLGGASGTPISPRVLCRAGNAASWLMAAAVKDGGKTMRLHVVSPEESVQTQISALCNEPQPAEPELVKKLAERLAWEYPRSADAMLPSKLTATQIKSIVAEKEDPEAESLVRPHRERRFRRPETGKPEGPVTGAERGIAQHLVMQYIRFDRTGTAEDIAGEIERLTAMGFLTERQAQAVPPEDILAFFRSPVGQRLLNAEHVTREFRFSLLCSADTWYPDAPREEEILLQGVVDCCMEENGELTVIDFKTDAKVEPELYREQLRAYAIAMERILKKPVKGAVLWYLRKKQQAELKFS